MSVESLNLYEVEQDRQRQALELATESGPQWEVGYRPGSAGCHELLDRTALVADLLERHLLAHPACIARPEWYLLAERAATALRELYQQVGAEHLAVEDPPGLVRHESLTEPVAIAGRPPEHSST